MFVMPWLSGRETTQSELQHTLPSGQQVPAQHGVEAGGQHVDPSGFEQQTLVAPVHGPTPPQLPPHTPLLQSFALQQVALLPVPQHIFGLGQHVPSPQHASLPFLQQRAPDGSPP